MNHFVIKELAAREMAPGVKMRWVFTDKVMVTFVDLADGAVIPPHQHPHDQITIMISGTLRYNVGGEIKEVHAGETVAIPGGVEHGVTVIGGPAVAYDCFSPVREDYINRK